MRDHARILLRVLCLTITVFVSFAAVARAQEITGTINGTVNDASGAAVKGATVTITDENKQIIVRTVETGDEGEYAAPLLPAGVYTVTVEAPSFKKSVQTSVKLDVNQRRTLDVSLEAGNVAEVVTVEADPLTVDLTTATASSLSRSRPESVTTSPIRSMSERQTLRARPTPSTSLSTARAAVPTLSLLTARTLRTAART
jgi:hypothetical protein